MKRGILMFFSVIISCYSLLGQIHAKNNVSDQDFSIYKNNYPPINLKYSSSWTVEPTDEQISSGNDINILLTLRTTPTSDVPSVGTFFILAIDSSYDKSIISDEKSYFEHLKTKMNVEYPFLFSDTLKTTIIDNLPFLTLTAYATMMGYFIQYDWGIFRFKDTYIIVLNIFDNEADKKNLMELVKTMEIGDQ